MSQSKPYAPKKLNTLHAWVKNRIHSKDPFVVLGKGTRSPHAGQDILSTKNLKEIHFFDPDDMVIGIQAGMTAADLQSCINKKKMFLPINPWYPESTIGSVLACNDFGPSRMNGGGLRDCIIGIEYINGKGELVKAGGKVVKNVSGYDLSRMMLGSLGGLGVITSVNFKVNPQPAGTSVLMCTFENDQWVEKIRELHAKIFPVDWIQAMTSQSGWILGVGFSGNDARRTRIEKELRQIFEGFGQSLDVFDENKKVKKTADAPGQNRFSGFLTPILKRFKLGKQYLHLHAVLPTGELLGSLDVQKFTLQGAQMVVHPIGGDFHIFLNDETPKAQKEMLTLLKNQLEGSEGKISLIKSAPELSINDLNEFAFPREYSLMKAIKQQLDPALVFHAPFYNY
ncbi:MAG: FAD-binding oxidoreductase [SAR324 cluster bacterium]|nr:FAD-binding oxidoreductase [SAR324 cluster bacterium]